jgi:hypothetical protein
MSSIQDKAPGLLLDLYFAVRLHPAQEGALRSLASSLLVA